jgi:hypothetical protein
MRSLLSALCFFLVITFLFIFPSCSLIKDTSCDTLASIVSEATKLACEAATGGSTALKASTSDYHIVLGADTCYYTVNIGTKFVEVSWVSTTGDHGTLTTMK